jgi:hypothetical protein
MAVIISDLRVEHAAYLIETVAPVAIAWLDEEEARYGVRALVVPDAGVALLAELDESSDGHLDEFSRIWIGGNVAGRIVGYRHEND